MAHVVNDIALDFEAEMTEGKDSKRTFEQTWELLVHYGSARLEPNLETTGGHQKARHHRQRPTVRARRDGGG